MDWNSLKSGTKEDSMERESPQRMNVNKAFRNLKRNLVNPYAASDDKSGDYRNKNTVEKVPAQAAVPCLEIIFKVQYRRKVKRVLQEFGGRLKGIDKNPKNRVQDGQIQQQKEKMDR